MKRMEHMTPDHIYFIQCGADGPIKIGITSSPRGRLMALQSASPFKLRILHTSKLLPAAARRYEAKLHRWHASSRLEGEWFRPTEDLLAHIGQIKSMDEYVEEEEVA